ncbi:MAG: Arm DNA-binding domain-containing protein [Roseburia faecis]
MAENNKIYITANEHAEMLDVSVGHAYKLDSQAESGTGKRRLSGDCGQSSPDAILKKRWYGFQVWRRWSNKSGKRQENRKMVDSVRYTDWQGKRRKSAKKRFLRPKEAEEWLRSFLITQKSGL